MLHLEALLAFIVFLLFLAFFLNIELEELRSAESARDYFNARLSAKDYALLMDSLYNNIYRSKDTVFVSPVVFPCAIEGAKQVVCTVNEQQASEQINAFFVSDSSRLNLREHYR